MTESEAAARIRGLAAANRIVLTAHAGQRARQRGAAFEDVRCALMSITGCRSEHGDRWKTLGGVDRDGDDLTCVVAIEGAVIVVTLF